MSYLTLKALHLIGMVAWFAGLFYIPRLFIYATEAASRPPPERHVLVAQFSIMARRLWFGITWPAMIFTLFFGTWLLLRSGQISLPWVHAKLALVLLLVFYHFGCGWHRRQIFVIGKPRWSSQALRLWNEAATILLVAIVLVATLKADALQVSVALGVVASIGVLTAAVFLYKKVRQRS